MVPCSISKSIPACAGEPAPDEIAAQMQAVYPRVCGGTGSSLSNRACHRGLSPRVRGNRPFRPAHHPASGSIPACAGEPAGIRCPFMVQGVYPRMCGGTYGRRPRRSVAGDLSPRVRGNLTVGTRYAGALRSIPACAGEPTPRLWCSAISRSIPACAGEPTPRLWCSAISRSIPACAGEPGAKALCAGGVKVYPRVCGGTHFWGQNCSEVCGLSPRVRGNQQYFLLEQHGARSIPACAGEPRRPGKPACRSGVYPRVCGGTTWRRWSATAGRGLSPRVRGNHVAWLDNHKSDRSIPACAGEPAASGDSEQLMRVYPRVCGGTLGSRWGRDIPAGLSPRVRGNPDQARLAPSGDHAGGSIPACAGEPPPRRRRRDQRRVYPRVCGGTLHTHPRSRRRSGLSPRVRGNLARRLSWLPCCHPRWVYPRVCGGTSVSQGCRLRMRGLSPRVRGNPRR